MLGGIVLYSQQMSIEPDHYTVDADIAFNRKPLTPANHDRALPVKKAVSVSNYTVHETIEAIQLIIAV